MDKRTVRTFLLSTTTFTYLLFGAAVFGRLESDYDNELREELSLIQDNILNKYDITDDDFHLFETIALKSVAHKAGHQWTFMGALYFALVVITTVGYGHSTPETVGGKLFCIIYAFMGIPLGLIMFQSIGERINMGLRIILTKIRHKLISNGFYVSDISIRHLLIISFSIGHIIIFIGVLVFSEYEGWSLFDSFYFCFITLSTIGFGDLVALQHPSTLHSSPIYILFTIFFILFGLSIFSACVNLLVLNFMTSSESSSSSSTPTIPPSSILLEHLPLRTLHISSNPSIVCSYHPTILIIYYRFIGILSSIIKSMGSINNVFNVVNQMKLIRDQNGRRKEKEYGIL